MSVNKFKDHILIVPEDDANRQLANGFVLHPSVRLQSVDIHPAVGGWSRVHSELGKTYADGLRKYPNRHLILLIDFDEQVMRRSTYFREAIPDDVSARVYILGTRSEPEPLRKNIGKSLEMIGTELAGACADSNLGLWTHEFLRHNDAELTRLIAYIKPFLFA